MYSDMSVNLGLTHAWLMPELLLNSVCLKTTKRGAGPLLSPGSEQHKVLLFGSI